MTDTTPLYLREFPDFGPLDIAIPPGFVDTSWHNDACPSWSNDTLGLKLWVNYADQDLREVPERFSLTALDDDDDIDGSTIYIPSDDWAIIVQYVLVFAAANAYASEMTSWATPEEIDALGEGSIGFGDLGIDDNQVMLKVLTGMGIQVFNDEGHIGGDVAKLWNTVHATAVAFYVPRLEWKGDGS